ncbi:hypothetical protein Patl1_23183 [Pistacia atlantica]|uniref:Uncharacterized protein n=1 Tax=Pistacia atlantica TaxID=434234 RepID=A0ACC0ZWG7_9ROSI|nr:hypothetical protein Patl1_23183 [Pistacia atlantica]
MRAPCCEKMGLKKGPWTAEEDQILVSFIQGNGHGNWRALPKQAVLYISIYIVSRWSAIAGSLPGRTDNEIKNYWHTHLKKRLTKENLISTNDNQISKPAEDLTTPEGKIQSPDDSQQRSGQELSDSVSIEGKDIASESSKGDKNVASPKGDSSNVMDFWFNIFMKAGNSMEILQQNLGELE